MPEKTEKLVFRPKARLLILLGDQLIRDPGLAVFELVKNAYDADASECTVKMVNITDPGAAEIIVEDNGAGMDEKTIRNTWLEPATDYRSRQKSNNQRSKKYRRLPLGDKGVGRFAVHKLGRKIKLITRMEKKNEVIVQIDWTKFDEPRYLSEVPVSVTMRPPRVFKKKTGTRIIITGLPDDWEWTRGKIRNLHRAVTSICSPFDKPEDFKASLALEPELDWLEGLPDFSDILEESLFHGSGKIYGSELVYNYHFKPLPAMRRQIQAREEKNIKTKLRYVERDRRNEELDLSQYKIGKIKFNFHIFDREPRVLELCDTDKSTLKSFLNKNGGVRIYRDGVRIFDFGEPGNDWLDLGGRRVNIPTVRISNNQIIGAISLDGASSSDLIEKTNREGFIENDAYDVFRQSVLFAITQIEAERKKDKERLHKIFSGKKQKEPVIEDMAELRLELEKRDLLDDLGKYLDRIEKQFTDVRDTLLTAAGSGLTLTSAIHEIEKIIKELQAVKYGTASKRIKYLVQHLSQMVDGLAFLARKSGSDLEKAGVLINQALFNTEYRLKMHQISTVNGIESDDPDFTVKCVRRLIISTLMNLIDNSIYWLGNIKEMNRQIYIGTTDDLYGKPAIIFADNGPGFTDPPEYVVQPFFSRKPDGMGLGLHIANEIAKLHNGRLLFPENSELGIPPKFTGAIIAFQFPEGANGVTS